MKLLSVAVCLVSAAARTAPWERKTAQQETYVKINVPDTDLPVNHLPVNHLPVNQLPLNHLPVYHLPDNHLPDYHLPDNQFPDTESQQKYVRPLWFEGYQGFKDGEPVPLAETTEQFVPQIPFVPQPSFAYAQPPVPFTVVMDQSVPQYAPQYAPQYVPQPEYGMPQYNYVNPPAGQYVPQPEYEMPQYNYVNPPAGQYVPQPEYGVPQYNYVNPPAGISVPQHAGPAMSMYGFEPPPLTVR